MDTCFASSLFSSHREKNIFGRSPLSFMHSPARSSSASLPPLVSLRPSLSLSLSLSLIRPLVSDLSLRMQFLSFAAKSVSPTFRADDDTTRVASFRKKIRIWIPKKLIGGAKSGDCLFSIPAEVEAKVRQATRRWCHWLKKQTNNWTHIFKTRRRQLGNSSKNIFVPSSPKLTVVQKNDEKCLFVNVRSDPQKKLVSKISFWVID